MINFKCKICNSNMKLEYHPDDEYNYYVCSLCNEYNLFISFNSKTITHEYFYKNINYITYRMLFNHLDNFLDINHRRQNSKHYLKEHYLTNEKVNEILNKILKLKNIL